MLFEPGELSAPKSRIVASAGESATGRVAIKEEAGPPGARTWLVIAGSDQGCHDQRIAVARRDGDHL